jgi:hypothetical protein
MSRTGEQHATAFFWQRLCQQDLGRRPGHLQQISHQLELLDASAGGLGRNPLAPVGLQGLGERPGHLGQPGLQPPRWTGPDSFRLPLGLAARGRCLRTDTPGTFAGSTPSGRSQCGDLACPPHLRHDFSTDGLNVHQIRPPQTCQFGVHSSLPAVQRPETALPERIPEAHDLDGRTPLGVSGAGGRLLAATARRPVPATQVGKKRAQPPLSAWPISRPLSPLPCGAFMVPLGARIERSVPGRLPVRLFRPLLLPSDRGSGASATGLRKGDVQRTGLPRPASRPAVSDLPGRSHGPDLR